MAVYSNGIFSSGVRVLFEDGESAVNAAIFSGGTMQIGKGGAVDSAVIASGGRLTVSSGGRAENISLALGGCLDFSVYGDDFVTSIMGKSYHGSDVTDSFSLKNSLAENFYLYALASGHVYSGGTAVQTRIAGMGSLDIHSGGIGCNTDIGAGGTMTVHRGGKVDSAVISSGALLTVSSGAVVSGIVMASGGILNVTATGGDSQTVLQGNGFSLRNGVVSSMTVYTGGRLTLVSGAVAENVTVMQGGHLDAGNTGVVSGLLLASGGKLTITVSGGVPGTMLTGQHQYGSFSVRNGIASNFVIYGGGELKLTANGKANGTVVSSGGHLIINRACVASGVNVMSGGRLTIADDGIAQNVILAHGGILDLELNGSGITSVTGYNQVPVSNSSGYIDLPFEVKSGISGFYASGLYLYSGTDVKISSGGSVLAAAIHSGGKLTVGSGGVASGLTQVSGGILNVRVNGYDSSTSISGVCSNVRFSLSRGSASNFWIFKDADFSVESGGVATGLLLYSGGRLSATVGGGNKGAKMISGLYTGDGFGGSFSLVSGSANGFQLFSGCQLTVSSGATVENLAMYEGGILRVVANGQDGKTKVSGHYISGISSGGTFSMYAAYASGLTVYNSGSLDLINGGKANETIVEYGGSMSIGSRCVASNTKIYAGGTCVVSGIGAAVSGLTVQRNAAVTIYGGVALAGDIVLGGQLICSGTEQQINCTDGVRFTLIADQCDGSGKELPFIGDCSSLFGAVSITVRTRIDQTPGLYVLAGNGQNYTRPINLTVINDDGVESSIGSLSLAEKNTVQYRNCNYRLNVNAENALCLSIAVQGYDDIALHVPEVTVERNGSIFFADWTPGLSISGEDNLRYETELYLDGMMVESRSDVSGTRLDLGSLTPNYKMGSVYELRVRAFDPDCKTGSGFGAWSSYEFSVEDHEAPVTGDIQIGLDPLKDTVDIFWSDFTDNGAICYYDVTCGDITQRVSGSAAGCTFSQAEMQYGHCDVEIKAVDYAGNEATVSDSFFMEDLWAPEKVSLLGQKPQKSGTVELTWEAADDQGSGISHYLLEYGYADDPESVKLAVVSDALEYTLQGIGKGDYSWRVCAVDYTGNQGEWSDSLYFRLSWNITS